MKRHLIVLAVLICSCSSFAYYNESLPKEGFSRNESASFMLRGDHDGALVLLALSGGGSRAAYFSSSVMFRLEKMGILQKVDAISSVSGGSITAAYYCMSGDRGEGGTVPSGREWDEPVVKRELKKNLIGRFAGNLFWPDNIALYWLTCYNRTHIMAQTLADNYFDTLPFGRDLTFRDLNPKRPGLIINSTLSTQNLFGQPFTFTDEDFRGVISSDINAFPLSPGVMASATFPGVFQYYTLRNYSVTRSKRFIHVFDGGIHDNLGLESLRRVIIANPSGGERGIVIILVDAFNDNDAGVRPTVRDTRQGILGYIVDSTIIDSFNAMLTNQREASLRRIDYLKKAFERKGRPVHFLHFQFGTIREMQEKSRSVELGRDLARNYKMLTSIPTNLKISDEHAAAIDQCTEYLFSDLPGNEVLTRTLAEVKKTLGE